MWMWSHHVITIKKCMELGILHRHIYNFGKSFFKSNVAQHPCYHNRSAGSNCLCYAHCSHTKHRKFLLLMSRPHLKACCCTNWFNHCAEFILCNISGLRGCRYLKPYLVEDNICYAIPCLFGFTRQNYWSWLQTFQLFLLLIRLNQAKLFTLTSNIRKWLHFHSKFMVMSFITKKWRLLIQERHTIVYGNWRHTWWLYLENPLNWIITTMWTT